MDPRLLSPVQHRSAEAQIHLTVIRAGRVGGSAHGAGELRARAGEILRRAAAQMRHAASEQRFGCWSQHGTNRPSHGRLGPSLARPMCQRRSDGLESLPISTQKARPIDFEVIPDERKRHEQRQPNLSRPSPVMTQTIPNHPHVPCGASEEKYKREITCNWIVLLVPTERDCAEKKRR